MPKLTARVPSYCRHKRSGIAVVYIDGREIPLGAFNSAASREKYNAITAEWLANGRALPTAQDDVTVLHVISKFLKHAEVYYRTPAVEVTEEVTMYKYALKIVRQLYGRTLAAEFDSVALEAVRDVMITPQPLIDRETKKPVIDPKTKKPVLRKGWSRQYTNRQIGRIIAAFRWAASKRMVPVGVVELLKTVQPLKRGRSGARETKKVPPVPEATVNATLPFLTTPVAALVKLELLTGARGGELLIMRGCDIDMSTKVWLYRPEQHKNAHKGFTREIRFGPQAQAIITPFLARKPTDYLFSPADALAELRERRAKARKTPATYGNSAGTNRKTKPTVKPGRCYTHRSYAAAIRKAAEKANVPHWHPHQLRHTFGTKMRALHGFEATNLMLGHESDEATEIYAEKDRSLAEKIMGEVG